MMIKLVHGRLRAKLSATRFGIKAALIWVPSSSGGWSSRTMDRKHILFLDYDFKAYEYVKEELEYVQLHPPSTACGVKIKEMSPFYTFSSSNDMNESGIRFGNYHALCMTKFTWGEILHIMNEMGIDPKYKSMTNTSLYGSWAIRAFPKLSAGKEVKGKPRFCEVIGAGRGLSNPISSGHLLQLMRHYDVPLIHYQKPDGYTRIWEVEYETFKGG